MPVHIGVFFLPHLDGFCHLSQDNPLLNQYLLALILGNRLYKKIGFYSKAIFELLEKSILGRGNWVSHPDIGGF